MQTNYKRLGDLGDLRGKRVLLRLDFNVPISGDDVRDDFRIQKSLPTLELLSTMGARTIVISHIESTETDSLSAVAAYVSKSVRIKTFVTRLKDAAATIGDMKDGEIIMLENLRKLSPGEKGNDASFAAELASLADVYINDAFAVSHREHASIVGVPKLLPSCAGPLLSSEIDELSKSFSPERPFIFILGGAKFETKLPLVDKFLKIADNVFIGGALANDIYKDRGFEVGRSLVSKSAVDLRRIAADPKVIVPSDVVVASPGDKTVKSPQAVALDESVMDAGPKTIGMMSDLLTEAAFILWNGPLGDYEHGYDEGTLGMAKAIVASGARSVIGGGDTIAVVAKAGLLDKFSFVSTGGGAMLDFLAKGTLPGIEALKN